MKDNLFIKSIKEFLLTFSKDKSLFSSKKIERFFSFGGAISIILTYFIVKLFCLVNCEMSIYDVLLLSGTLLTYGGFTTKQIAKDANNTTTSTT